MQQFIRSCLNSVNYSILLNGGNAGSFSSSRGLRQSDPLSPFLFVLSAKFLSRLLLREEEEGRINDIKISRKGFLFLISFMRMTFLLYAGPKNVKLWPLKGV